MTSADTCFGSVLFQARAAHRSTQRRLVREVRAASAAEVITPLHVRSEVLDALRRLSVRQRAVVFLTYCEDLSVQEIATLLDASVRTVQRDLKAAEGRLEVLLQ